MSDTSTAPATERNDEERKRDDSPHQKRGHPRHDAQGQRQRNDVEKAEHYTVGADDDEESDAQGARRREGARSSGRRSLEALPPFSSVVSPPPSSRVRMGANERR